MSRFSGRQSTTRKAEGQKNKGILAGYRDKLREQAETRNAEYQGKMVALAEMEAGWRMESADEAAEVAVGPIVRHLKEGPYPNPEASRLLRDIFEDHSSY